MRPVKKILRIYHGFIIPVTLLVVCAIVGYFGIYPGINSIKILWDETNTLQAQTDQIKKRVKVLQALDLTTLEIQRDDLLKAVPQEKSLPTILTTVETMAAQSGLTITDMTIVNPGSVATDSANSSTFDIALISNTLPITLSAVGNIDQFYQFFEKSTSIRRLIKIKNASLGFDTKQSSSLSRLIATPSAGGLVTGSMNLYAFFAPLPTTLGKGTDQLEPLTTKQEELLSKISAFELLEPESLGLNVITGAKLDPFSP